MKILIFSIRISQSATGNIKNYGSIDNLLLASASLISPEENSIVNELNICLPKLDLNTILIYLITIWVSPKCSEKDTP